MTILNLVLYLIISISFIYYIFFVASQGKDERGQEILTSASQVALFITMVGFIFQAFFFTFVDPTIDQVEILIATWMASVFLGNVITIIVKLNKQKA
ncbi:hypothetical protein [Alkalibacillus almallahensis]|uniref:hypothetical protein n=1 Tax=Alkalibacillus almallahensis TaxID=1379154 RepID=UPI00141FD5BB|nr:hypothetical protein [Alkalibacillus almallahensis]NIK13118.1 fatty acid desaturase [Alkalibacillus almallahensis]